MLGAQAGVKDGRTVGSSVKASSSFSSSVSVSAAGAAAPLVIAAAVTSDVGENNGGENGRSPCCLVVRAREVDEEEENKGSVPSFGSRLVILSEFGRSSACGVS